MPKKFKIGDCIQVTKGRFKGTRADIIRREKGSYLAGNSKATYRVYSGWIKKVRC